MPESGEGSRKRPRLDDEEGDSTMQIEAGTSGEATMIVHDPTYNSCDGDICVIQVENTIFKVHRFLLSRDSIMFKDMFSAPEIEQPQGFTENNPIVLHDDVDDFRILCWALYALPTELNDQLSVNANVDRINKLARIANKYQFVSLESWSLTTVIHHCTAHNLMGRLRLDRSPTLLKTASQCNSPELQKLVEDGILSRLDDTNLSAWSGLVKHFDTYGSRRLKGMVYYHLLQLQERVAPKVQPDTSALRLAIFVDPDSDKAQWIYRGYWSLSKWWDHFVSKSSTTLPRAEQCPVDLHAHCQTRWPGQRAEIFLKADAPGISKLDILKRLTKIETATQELANSLQLPAHNWMIVNTSPARVCLMNWLQKVVHAERQKLMDTMADHFFGYVFQPPAPAQAGSSSTTTSGSTT